MRFIWIDDNKYPDDIPFLKGNYEVVDSDNPDALVYQIKNPTDNMLVKLETLESAGMLKIVRTSGIKDINSFEDIIDMTVRVEKIKSSPMYLKVFFPDASFLLSETELLSSSKFRRCLLREGKFISIPGKAWTGIVQHWLDVADEVVEESEDEQIIDLVLNYLCNCTVYKDVDKALARNTLFFDEADDGVVYSLTGNVVDFVNSKYNKNSFNSRNLRAILSEFIVGNSVQRRIFTSRYRFWRFSIPKVGIDLDKQLFVEDEFELGLDVADKGLKQDVI
ncbi:MAG: hypothetical protein DRM99_00825 [Thermoplasmata archaeon]|nr:MAG: hypothetical protein DRM99_00825 [Thermoplasmata archaeon]